MMNKRIVNKILATEYIAYKLKKKNMHIKFTAALIDIIAIINIPISYNFFHYIETF